MSPVRTQATSGPRTHSCAPLAVSPWCRRVASSRQRGWAYLKAPTRLAEPSSLAKSKTGLGCHAVDENFCSPNGVPQTGPSSIGCDEMRSVLRLVGVDDTSKLDMVAHAFRRSFNHEIETVEGALPCRKDAMTVC